MANDASLDRFKDLFDQVLTRHVVQENSAYSTTDLAVLRYISNHELTSATGIAQALGVDKGYLSRILRRFNRDRLIRKFTTPGDGRAWRLQLTPSGEEIIRAFSLSESPATLAFMEKLGPARAQQFRRALAQLTTLLSDDGAPGVTIRQPQLGDLGMIVHRHGALIAREFGWDIRFEALCARIIAQFVANYDASSERAYIVEQGGDVVGSLFLMRENDTTARLRLLYVEPHLRGQGIARRLLTRAIDQARAMGYETLILFTNKGLDAAAHLYRDLGFEMTNEAPHDLFGEDQMGQDWTLAL